VSADSFECVLHAAIRGLRLDPELRVDEWSEEFMVLPKSAACPVPTASIARRILQGLSPRHPAKRVVIRAASQMLRHAGQAPLGAARTWSGQPEAKNAEREVRYEGSRRSQDEPVAT